MKYIVKSGDSPYKIAKKLGVSFASLIAANSQKPTTVIAGVRTFASLLPDEELFAPVGSGNVNVTLEVDTSLDVEATAGHAINVLNADQNYCVSVRHSGTPVNKAIHNFKKAWNASGQDIQLPVNTGKYEPVVARALSAVMPNLPVPDGCDEPSPNRHRGVFIDHRGVAGVGDDASDAEAAVQAVLPTMGLPGNTITGPGFTNTGTQSVPALDAIPPMPTVVMPPVAPLPTPTAAPAVIEFPDTHPPPAAADLATLASAAASALSADPNHCKSVGQPGSAVNTAVHAFKQAWNAANPGSKVPVGTGKYEVSVAAAIMSLLGAGVAPDGCGPAKHVQPPPVAAPPAPPPVAPAAVAVVTPPAPAIVQAAILPPPPVAPAPPAARTFAPPPAEVLVKHRPAPPLPSPPPAASSPSTAAQALALVDPCAQVNVAAVWAFQKSVGEDPDGKYGTTTANALAKLVPGAPSACRPRPAWWAPHGQKNRPGAPGAEHHPHRPRHVPRPPVLPPPPPVTTTAITTVVPPLPDPPPDPNTTALPDPPPDPNATATIPSNSDDSSAMSTPATPAVPASALPDPPPVTATPPGKHGRHIQQAGLTPSAGGKKEEGLSTGMLIAGGIGAAALIGIVAAAASGKGKTIIHKYRKAPSAAPAASKEKR
jgi:hypothetical protein